MSQAQFADRPVLGFTVSDGSLILDWDGGGDLQRASSPGGLWESIPDASSPFSLDPLIDTFGFFRVLVPNNPVDAPPIPSGTDPTQPTDPSLPSQPGTAPVTDPTNEPVARNDDYVVAPGVRSRLHVSDNDDTPQGGIYSLEKGPDLDETLFLFDEDGSFLITMLTYGDTVTFTYRIQNGDQRSAIATVTVKTNRQLLVDGLSAFDEGIVRIPVLEINELHYPIIQFSLANHPQDICQEPHWHADLPRVSPLENPQSSIVDPAPRSCGFGRETEVLAEFEELSIGGWRSFLQAIGLL